ncbi:MAG: D-alanyl-D-alanine carboxypeptidase/D-alanyl-D-alanine-endopeptidase [Chitinophagaceae bacterium]
MRKSLILSFCFITLFASAQSVKEKLANAVQQLEADSLLRHAIIGFYVADSKTGLPVYEHNAQVGLAPASTQKIFTSIAAFELLGHDFKYSTAFNYLQDKKNPGAVTLQIESNGDPSFGSSRYISAKANIVLNMLAKNLSQQKVKTISSTVFLKNKFDDNIPGGWIWEDIGNYYGATAQNFNWIENQFDIVLQSGKNIGDSVGITALQPASVNYEIEDAVIAAAKGTGDKTIVYIPYAGKATTIAGTIPIEEKHFEVSAAITDPRAVFCRQLQDRLKKEGIVFNDKYENSKTPDTINSSTVLYKYLSPTLDSLNYWFLRKSINLYGEAFLKTIAFKESGIGSTQKGLEVLKDFWTKHGIEKTALNTCDGSGLSPQNRVTANAEVQALLYAKTRPWFDSFYDALPTYNGIKMKSGSIGGARAFTGYQKAQDGKDYCFSIIVNNYSGEAIATIRKIYALLDILK